MSNEHTVKSYEEELRYLIDSVIKMGSLTESQLVDSMDAVIKVDKDSIDKIIKSDDEINKFRSKIDTQIMTLLVKRAPMAIDLRETISSLKISQDLERIGDLSKSNAKKVKPLPLDLPEELLGNLKRLGDLVIKQLNDVLDSYVNKNYDKAKEVWEKDEQVDDLTYIAMESVIDFLSKEADLKEKLFSNKMNGKIFIIEDEPSIIQLVQHNLEKNGFIVSSSVNGNDGLKELKKFQPDLLLLDWMLPDLSGIEICKNIRKDNSIKNLPVIMLTAKGEEEDKIKGLDSGVDDYLTKPFSFNELMARIKAVLRRSNPNTVSDNLEFEDLVLDRIEKRVYRDKKEIQLGPTEFRLLEFSLVNPKRVYSRDQILENVWPNNINVESRTIDVHIRRLRKSINIQNKKELIRTVRSSGYSLI